MYLPTPNSPVNGVMIRAIENRWFDDFGEFYTYINQER